MLRKYLMRKIDDALHELDGNLGVDSATHQYYKRIRETTRSSRTNLKSMAKEGNTNARTTDALSEILRRAKIIGLPQLIDSFLSMRLLQAKPIAYQLALYYYCGLLNYSTKLISLDYKGAPFNDPSINSQTNQ